MNPNRLFALVILLFAVGYLAMATQITQPNAVAAVGPRVFPVAIGIGLVCSGLWLFGWPGAVEAVAEGESAAVVSFDWLRVVSLLLLLIGYIALFRPLGYILSTTIFMFAGVQLLGDRATLLRDLLTSVLLIAAISFVFARLLGINLPDGLLGW
jgi:putative tricarboxylic transport membrane protein